MNKISSSFGWDYMCDFLVGKFESITIPSNDHERETNIICTYVERNVPMLILHRSRHTPAKRSS